MPATAALLWDDGRRMVHLVLALFLAQSDPAAGRIAETRALIEELMPNGPWDVAVVWNRDGQIAG